MTAFEVATACRRACRRASIESWTDQLTAYVAIKDFHMRPEDVAEVVGRAYYAERALRDRFQKIEGRTAVMIFFNRFAVELAHKDLTALRVLEVARTYLKDGEEEHG